MTLPEPLDADGVLEDGCRVVAVLESSEELDELEPELESELLDWALLVELLDRALLVCPGKVRAAMAENAAVSVSAPASNQRVSRETRRRPASRRPTAPRSGGPDGADDMEAPLVR